MLIILGMHKLDSDLKVQMRTFRQGWILGLHVCLATLFVHNGSFTQRWYNAQKTDVNATQLFVHIPV